MRGLSGLARLIVAPKRDSEGYAPRKLDECRMDDGSDVQTLMAAVKGLIDFMYSDTVD